MNLVRNHSHWGAFFAEVEGGRVVGVQPFEKDPDPSHLINAIPESVHSKSRIAQPMVREGYRRIEPWLLPRGKFICRARPLSANLLEDARPFHQ